MQTQFTLAQLADPQIAEADKILRACVHCGFCTATCPTYVLLGDERDSPRGRIYLIKEMLEHDQPATVEVTTHVDRCLSCLSCMTTCPSGVHYMHLVDHARHVIEATYRRPWLDRLMRSLLAFVLPHNNRLRLALQLGALGKPFARLLAALRLRRLAALLELAPGACRRAPSPRARAFSRPQGPRKGRVALMTGCVTPVVGPSILDAAVRVLSPSRHRGRGAGGAGLLRRLGSSHGPRAKRRMRQSAATLRHGRRSRRRRSTPSWSPPRAAAPPSRTTASCCAMIPFMDRRQPVFRR